MSDRIAQILSAAGEYQVRITDRDLNILLESTVNSIHLLDRTLRLAPQEEHADTQTLWYLAAAIKILQDRLNTFKNNHNLQRFEWLTAHAHLSPQGNIRQRDM
jgi:hypothetical protein